MTKHIYTLLLIVLGACTSMQAQNISLQGQIIDSLDQSIIGASVMLTSKADSVLTGFSITDGNGGYLIGGVATGEYFLQITYMGYRTHVEYVNIDASKGDRAMEKIVLQEGNTMLEEVVVMEDRIPILIKKDTIEYNASSFETRKNAVVEDLLRELPGVEVEEDGTIKAQGKEVSKLLVDGEEFFGDDPSVASKNLPAKVVDKVQVYDEKTDEQQFSGLEVGEKDKVMNLKLKEEYKQGYFGKALAGGGTDRRFKGEFNLNRFDKKNQVSLISKFNNINQTGFSFREYADFMGGFSNIMDGNDDGTFAINSSIPLIGRNNNTSGNKTTGIVGLNYNNKINDVFKINTNYSFNMVNDNLISDSRRTNFVNGVPLFDRTENRTSNSNYYAHNAYAKLTFELDTTQKIVWNNTFGLNKSKADNNSSYTNTDQENRVTDNGTNDYDDDRNTYSLSSRLSYRKRFKPGRTLSSVSKINYNANNSDANTQFDNQYYDSEGIPTFNETLNRREDRFNSTLDLSQKLTYVEPLGKFTRWSNSYEFGNKLNKWDNETEDLENGTYQEVVDLSRDFDFNNRTQAFDTKFTYVRSKYTLALGTKISQTQLSIDEGSASILDNPYWFVLPNARARIELGKTQNISLDYSTSTQMPSFNQLQPVTNNTNPLRVVVGNPNLDPEYTHRIRLSYYLFDSFNFNTLFLNASHSMTPNTIINTSTYDAFFVETIQPVNSTLRSTSTLNVNYSSPLNFMKSKWSLRAGTTFSSSPFNLNGQNLEQDLFSQNIKVSIGNKKKKVVDVNLSYQWEFSNSKYSSEEFENIKYINHTVTARSSVVLGKGFTVGTDANYRRFNSSNLTDDTQWVIWNAYLEKILFKNEKGKLTFNANDMLNQNRGFSQTANAFYTLEENTNNIGRYFMLTFSYNLSFFSKEK